MINCEKILNRKMNDWIHVSVNSFILLYQGDYCSKFNALSYIHASFSNFRLIAYMINYLIAGFFVFFSLFFEMWFFRIIFMNIINIKLWFVFRKYIGKFVSQIDKTTKIRKIVSILRPCSIVNAFYWHRQQHTIK